MNQNYRVAQKIGLMFRPETSMPNDIKSWAISQLHSNSPALGIRSISSKVEPWPQSLQPDLDERAELFRLLQGNYKKNREIKNSAERQSKDHDNKIKHSMIKKDELKFAHRNVYGNDQIRLRLMSFWSNHFTIGDVFMNEALIGHAMEDAILANLNGSFSDMLYKVTTHPGMLTYLDNNNNAGEESKHNTWCKRQVDCQSGLNDNLGRELLELHTVSPRAGYSEADIKQAAKVLAGWGAFFDTSIENLIKWNGTSNHWDMFKSRYAEPGNKTVMGKVIGTGKGGLRQLTDFLASNEYTIMHISEKLCHHFVSDTPHARDIDFVANAWKQSQGNLDQIHSAIIELVVNSKEDKFQWPINWLFQVIRLSDASYFHGWDSIYSGKDSMDVDDIFTELGQSFFSERQPNGYSNLKEDWLSGEMFERRLRFASAIHKLGRVKSSPEQIMDRIGANMKTRDLVKSAGQSSTDRFTALMCSPELMGLKSV